MKLNKAQRQVVYNKYGGKCAYCGSELGKSFHADHIDPVRRNWWENTVLHPERETLENFNPSCASCNIQKNSYTLEQFRENIKQFVNSLNQYSTQYKFAKRYGLVLETEIDVKFYFETINPTNKKWRRAISLDGLEDNNGWIKFNSEVEIEPTTNYWVRTSNDVIQLLHGSIINSIKTKNLIQITHIIPIIEPKPPLYNEE